MTDGSQTFDEPDENATGANWVDLVDRPLADDADVDDPGHPGVPGATTSAGDQLSGHDAPGAP